MSTAQATFCRLLKSAGYSITTARLTVFDALKGQEPLSMHQLVARAESIDRASVYRAVELFERLGIVERLHTGWKYTLELTDKFAAHHHHLSCTNCGTTVALAESELEDFIERMARTYGFVPQTHQIEVQGLCQKCRIRPMTP